MVKYTYDAWGNPKIIDEAQTTISSLLAIHNPFLFKGYIFDSEIGYYYLNSRYYDPQLRRFINADSINYLDSASITSLNLYSYCENNPIMRIDPSGNSWKSWLKGISSGLMIAAGVELCFVPGAQVIGAALIVTGAGGLIGGAIGEATGAGFDKGWNVGTTIGAAVGLAITAPSLIGLTLDLSIPTGLGIGTTSIGTSTLIISSTASISIPIGAIGLGTLTTGLMYFAKKSDLKQVEQAARQAGIPSNMRREFGDYIESLKESVGKRGNVNFTFKKLLEIAKEFIGFK